MGKAKSRKQWVNFKEVRARLNFNLVLSYYDIPAGKGDDFKIPCPFHDDHKPSCSVSTRKDVFHCFSCGAKGNTLDFVTLMNGGDISDTGDVREGALLALEILGDSPKPAKSSRSRKRKGSAKKSKNSPAETNSEGVSRKKQSKRANPKKGSQNASEATIRQFGEAEGYGDNERGENPVLTPLTFSLKLRPSHAYLRDRDIDTKLAEKYGIGYCARGMMKGRICFPLYSAESELVGYSGRYVDTGGDIPKDVSRYKLPQGFPKQSVLYNYDQLCLLILNQDGEKSCVIVEGFWSAIKWTEAGFPAVACMGHALSSEQCSLLVKAGIESAVIIFDGDSAGREALPNALVNLTKAGIWAGAVHLDDGQKPDAFGQAEIETLMLGEPLKMAS